MTPTKQEIEFFKEAKRIQQEWEPKFGDWAIGRHSKDIVLIVGVLEYTLDMVPMSWEGWEEGMIHNGLQKHLIFLPRQGQLQAMLEEKGYAWKSDVNTVREKGYYGVTLWCIAKRKYHIRADYTRHWYGPTPSIALGRALIEVLREQPNDQEEA